MHSNDPENPIARLNLLAFVKVEIELNPERVNLTELLPEDKKTQNVELTNSSGVPLKISSIISQQDFISVNLASTKLPVSLKPHEKMSFQLNVDASLMKDKTWGQVIIQTDNSHTPQVTVYVSGRIKSVNQNQSEVINSPQMPLPSLKFSEEAQKLFNKYNFVYNNNPQNLANCKLNQAMPMKAYIQMLVDEKASEDKITEAIKNIYGAKAIPSLAQNSSQLQTQVNRPKLKESIEKALKDNPKLKLDLFVMSYCPFAFRAEEAISKILTEFGSHINLHMGFIANPKSDAKADSGNITDLYNSLHGPVEVEEDFRQVLIQKYFPEKLFPYLQLRNPNIKNTDWKECASKVGIDSKKLEDLLAAKESIKLFSENIAWTKEMKAHASPTLFINGVKYEGGFK